MNLLPGQGLGLSGSQLLGFGLGAMTVTDVPIPPTSPREESGGGYYARVYDNAYSRKDDAEIIELLSILFQVIE
jgi:hypothetical protein